MEGQLIVSISREFGSGGHDIAKKLSEELDIKFYDKNILDEIVKANSSAEQLKEYDEMPDSFFGKKFGKKAAEQALARMQFDFIHKRAELGESFVVVGRCSDVVLSGFDGLYSFFVRGDKKQKVKRVMKKYGVNENDALALMELNDKQRKQYHNQYADYKWGDSRAYDMCINSSRLGVDKTVSILKDYIGQSRK